MVWRRGAGVDEAVLAELRAIRSEIHDLTERVGQSATRDDLDDYVTREAFNAHVAAHRQWSADWRWWAVFAVSALALLVGMANSSGVHLVIGG